jgi:multiple sugar transport system ATP-binding protein
VRCAVDGTGVQPGAQVTLGVRPEHFVAGGGGENRLQAEVTFVESLGGTTHAYCRFDGLREGQEALTCELDGALRVKAGDRLDLGVPASATYLFDVQGRALPRLAAEPGRQAA